MSGQSARRGQSALSGRSALEREYRRALSWYPKAWRDRNEDALVGTLLDTAEAAGRSRASFADRVNLAGNGLRARFGWFGRVIPASIRDRASLLAIGVAFGISLVMFTLTEWVPWRTPSLDPTWRNYGEGFGPFWSSAVVIYALWAIAFGCALAGLARVARAIVVLSLFVGIALQILSEPLGFSRSSGIGFGLLTGFAVVAIIGRVRATAINRIVLIAAAVLGSALVVGAVWRVTSTPYGLLHGWNPRIAWQFAWNPLLFLGAFGLLAVVALVVRQKLWALALLVVSLPWLALLAIALMPGSGLVPLLGAVGLFLTVAIVFVVLRVRGYRLAVFRRDRV